MSLAAVPADGLRAVTGGLEDLDARYGADVWRAPELGVRAARGRERASFTGISPPWFKAAAKAWARQRLTLDGAFNTVQAGTLALRRFSWFIAWCQPPIERPEQIDRSLLEAYLAWLAAQPLADATKALSRVFLRCFLDENRRYAWVQAIPTCAVIYHDEVGHSRRSLPRFIPEFVMAQLESEANLDQLLPHYRHLVVVITETGLRVGDACSLSADALVSDTAGWPCLRFEAHKMRAELIVPLSDIAVTALRNQQRLVAGTWAQGSPWLFPCRRNPSLPQGYDAFLEAFTHWQQVIGLHDEAGQSIHVVPHQLRHSSGNPPHQQGRSPARDPAASRTRQPGDDFSVRPPARHHLA